LTCCLIDQSVMSYGTLPAAGYPGVGVGMPGKSAFVINTHHTVQVIKVVVHSFSIVDVAFR
jgi:hypothetical protein